MVEAALREPVAVIVAVAGGKVMVLVGGLHEILRRGGVGHNLRSSFHKVLL